MARLFGDYSAPGNNERFVNADVCPHGISGSTQRHAEPCVFKTTTTPCRCSMIGLVFFGAAADMSRLSNVTTNKNNNRSRSQSVKSPQAIYVLSLS